MQLIVLGRQPAISLAELESLFGADAVEPISNDIAVINAKADITVLGGVIKVAEVLRTVKLSKHHQLAGDLAALIPSQDAKFNLGVSWHEGNLKDSKALALEIKKLLRKQNQKVRVVMPNDSAVLSSAQVWHNRLEKSPNIELVLAAQGQNLVVARTEQVQDIESYAARDHGRPARDAKVGMLPPKLAQIMINMSGVKSGRILDPFCGTGVVLQEAQLMGYECYGSDIETRMIEYSKKNLDALKLNAKLEVSDATSHKWQGQIDAVVSETYLGPPLFTAPGQHKIDQLARESGSLLSAFLKNIHSQIASGTPLVLAIPAWQSSGKTTRSTVVDQIEALGYTRRSFKTVRDSDLIYRRDDQVVGRELLILTRK